MDYDDNVHNFKVAGEDTSKTSSALRPYTFPRFELDDSLQGHLRFDSLVETDVFLGIRSQDENQWISDLSISRQSNVWFEAASSESVEMLLKSVGQEQIQPKDTVSESDNTCKELCSLEKEMEPKFEQDNVNNASTQDELLNNVSGLENHVKTKTLEVEGSNTLEVHVDSQIMEQDKLKDDVQSMDNVLLTDNLEQEVTKLGNPHGEQCTRSEENMGSGEELDLKFSSDEVDNVTRRSLIDGKKGNLVLGSNSQSSLIKGENESSRDKISNAKNVDLGESLIVPVSSSSCYKEDSEVKADEQSNAIENEDDFVQTEKEEKVSLPSIVIDASSGTCVAPTSQDEPIVNQLHSENEGKMETDASDSVCKINDNEDINKQVADEVGVACKSKSGVHHCDDSAVDKDSVKHECNSPTIISSVITPPDGGSEIAVNMPSTSQDLKGKLSSSDDNSFTFKVNPPPYSEAEKANTWTPFPIAETYNTSVVPEEVTTPDAEKTEAKLGQETSSKGASKSPSGRKRKGSEKGAAKESSQKGVIIKETMPDRPSNIKEITSTVPLSSVPTSDKSKNQSMKCGVPTSLALKNHRACHPHFTESQQIQLRAQIFVYGSVIQGIAPDEACMTSAFRPSGRAAWEIIWQAAVERVHRQRSKPATETPMKSNSSGAKVAETKVFPPSVSPLIPLPSPLWRPVLHYQSNISPRPPYHSPPLQNIIGHTTQSPRLSQTSAIATTVRDLSSPAPSSVKNLPSPSSVYTDTTTTVHSRTSQLSDQIKGPSADSKPRKRKKAQPLDSTQNLSCSVTTPVGLVFSASPQQVSNLETLQKPEDADSKPRTRNKPQTQTETTPTSNVLTSCSTSQQILQKVEDARLLSEEAAGFAATAVSHYQNLWSELAKQDLRTAGEAEAQIAAAAAGAAAAAASVAKAASAAAKVASNAALQAKLMADEAFIETEARDASERSNIQIVESDSTRSSYILVEEGKIDSAAAKQAENLRYVVEAAKLAAKAVTQAGKVVAMVEPIPLKEIISAGPDGYWKLPGDENEEKVNIGSGDHGGILVKDPLNHSSRNTTTNDKDKLSVLGSTSGTISVGTDNGSNIKEGSAVEVYKDGEALKPAWFSATVLSLNDGKAHVQYTSLLSKEGSDHLKEWVALEGEGYKAPRIRASLPMTASHSQGTRKRRRSALGNHVWKLGDLVDVRFQDSWCQGIVIDKNEKDEATLAVHFPARGESSAVSTQQLRFSLMWNNGNWVQWSRLSGHDSHNESDMPLEKRARLKSPLGKPNSQESNLQALSTSDMNFNVGKSSKTEKKPNPRRPWKTGVSSGVPKPGIKRKFVEVSKEFTASQNGENNNESKDQVKFTKYLKPHGKNVPKADTKEKVTSHKPRNSSSRTAPKRDNLVSSASSELDAEKSAVEEQKVDDDDNNNSSKVDQEPRRSNRRVQPTHKLLEGLQSSLIIPKMTSISNDKGQAQKSALSRGK